MSLSRRACLAVLAGGVLLAGCARTVPPSDSSSTVISGSLTWRAGKPPPGAQAIVTVIDVGSADAAARVRAQLSLEAGGREPPLPFSISLPKFELPPGNHLALRAVIRDADGGLLWTTDSQHLIDAAQSQQTLQPLQLVPTRPQVPAALVGLWRVEDIGGVGMLDRIQATLNIGANGQVAGSSGCNSYHASLTAGSDAFTLGPIATTRKACVPAVDAQEQRFLALIGAVSRWQVRGDGALELRADDGRRLLARR